MYKRKLVNSFKYSFSMLVSLIILYPLLALTGTFIEKIAQIFNSAILSRIAAVFINPPVFSYNISSSVTIDLLPVLIILLAGIWGWYRIPGKSKGSVIKN